MFVWTSVRVFLHFFKFVFKLILKSDNLVEGSKPCILDLLRFCKKIVYTVFSYYWKLMFVRLWLGHWVAARINCNNFLKKSNKKIGETYSHWNDFLRLTAFFERVSEYQILWVQNEKALCITCEKFQSSKSLSLNQVTLHRDWLRVNVQSCSKLV